MKRVNVIGTMLVVACAFGATVAASAIAVEWLEGLPGAAIHVAQASAMTGTLLMEDTKTAAGKSWITCTATLEGTVGPGSVGSVQEVLNAKGETTFGLPGLALLGTGSGSECHSETGSACAEGSTTSPIEVWPEGLPWDTELLQDETGMAFLMVLGAGYEILCLVLGINVEDLCSGEAELLGENNETEDDVTIPANTVAAPNLACTMGGAGSAVNETRSAILIFLLSGNPLGIG